MWGFMSEVFSLIQLIHLIGLCQTMQFFPYSCVVELEIRGADTSRSSFIVQDCFSSLEFFPYEVEYCSFKDCKELCWNFDGNCFGSVDCLGRTVILTVFILMIHIYGRSFHLLVSSSISFFKDLKFLSSRSFICLFCEVCCFPAFVLNPLIVFVCRRATDFFLVNLVSSHFTKGVC